MLVIQARSGSSRLPRKVLAPILGRPMILRLVDRVRSARLAEGLVVATTLDPTDDELAHVLIEDGVTVRRGPVADVLARFMQVVDEFAPDTVVRLTGDNPLVDQVTVDLTIHGHRDAGADYTTNGLSKRFPHGLNVEVVETDALRRLGAMELTVQEREHVTLGMLRRPQNFSLAAVTQEPDRSQLRWTVDTAEDLAWARTVFEHLHPSKPGFGQDDVVALLERHPELRRTLGDLP